ncbi:response regulator transcription factor [Bradyrhizobium lablabi]|uniref:response regulator transcription factor n=1 Tax=Bradyrhizobium lablabi TaxID=722472 RepID=UPI00090B76BA|nr:response regulator transcription factor [Bradyrhizobium lablabi]SHK64880.1 two-component system, OmpR family, response regulator/two-component system, OmpR family, torCAD operon response regulator TorR [Bradyrhizobium lablabi]
MIRVIVVEDETLTRRAIALGLREQNFEVLEAADALACKALLRGQRVEAIVLDVGLPGLNGLSLVKELREQTDLAILIVTRRGTPEARIEALDLGADDYLVKPVHHGELAARIRSVMRRCSPMRGKRKRLGRWLVDLEARSAVSGDLTASLTRGEFEIITCLIEANSKIVSREGLLSAISRRPMDSDLRSVDTLVSRLRRKLGDDTVEPNLIVTAPGFGYRLGIAVEEA